MAATGTIAPYVKSQWFTNDGDPASGYQLFTYEAGTSTKLATYSDANLSVANTNPIVLDSAGRASVYLTAASYKFVMASPTDTDPPSSPIWTQDNVPATPTTNVNLDVPGTAGENLSAGDAVYLSDGSGGNTAGRWYKTDADNTYSSTDADGLGMVPDAITSGDEGSIRVTGRITGLAGLSAGTVYYISATAGAITSSAPSNARAIAVADSTTSVILSQWLAPPVATQTLPGIVSTTTQTFGGNKTFANDVTISGTLGVTGAATFTAQPLGYMGGSSTTTFGIRARRIGAITAPVTVTATAETDVLSVTLPANAFAAGDAIVVYLGSSGGTAGNAKTTRLYVGANNVTIGSGGTGTSASAGSVVVQRIGATTVAVSIMSSGGLVTGGAAYQTITVADFAVANVFKVTGQVATAGTLVFDSCIFEAI